MHRFFFLLIIWILVEAYWIIPQSETAKLDVSQTRSANPSCVEELPMDSLEQKLDLEYFKD